MKIFSALIIAGLFIVCFSGCAIDYAQLEEELRQGQADYAQAWCDRDIEAISEIWAHDDDICIIPGDVSVRVIGWDGPNGVKARYEKSFAAKRDVDFKIHDLMVKVSKDGTAGLVTYLVENNFTDLDGVRHQSKPRITVMREKRDGAWKTIHANAAFSTTTVIDYAQLEEELRQGQADYAQAWCDRDIDAISEIWAHDDDINIFPGDVNVRVIGWDGPNGVKARYEKSFASMTDVDFKIHELMVKVSRDGTAGLVTYLVENDFTDLDGNRKKSAPRITVMREKRDGAWKTIHAHASFSTTDILKNN